MSSNEKFSRITYNGIEYDFDACVNLMDDRLFNLVVEQERLSGWEVDDQRFFDAYAEAHALHFGEEFVVN